jgi:hypothetical protein
MTEPTVPNSNQPIADPKGMVTQVWQRFFGALVAPPAAATAVAVSASPTSFTASERGSVVVSGGTISAVTLNRAGTVLAFGTTRSIPVANGDLVTVTYSVAPTINFLPA